MRAQLVQHLVPVAPELHVDEVDHDDPAQVPQPQLARDLPGGLQVGPEDRLFGVRLPGVTAGVDVDRDERFGRLDDQIATRR